MKYKFIHIFPFFLLGLLLLSSCNLSPEITKEYSGQQTNTGDSISENSGYPIEASYPITEIDSGYPINPYPDNVTIGPDFFLDEPLQSGELIVTGSGPAGVPIKLIDLSEIDLELGRTTIKDDGHFEFTLTTPLSSGHTIGIGLGDITGTDFNEEDFWYNENYYERPYVGIMFDIVIVE